MCNFINVNVKDVPSLIEEIIKMNPGFNVVELRAFSLFNNINYIDIFKLNDSNIIRNSQEIVFD